MSALSSFVILCVIGLRNSTFHRTSTNCSSCRSAERCSLPFTSLSVPPRPASSHEAGGRVLMVHGCQSSSLLCLSQQAIRASGSEAVKRGRLRGASQHIGNNPVPTVLPHQAAGGPISRPGDPSCSGIYSHAKKPCYLPNTQTYRISPNGIVPGMLICEIR